MILENEKQWCYNHQKSKKKGSLMYRTEVQQEFALKWINLCIANLGEEGNHDPIERFEYLGNFYIQEGNKRVSFLRTISSCEIAVLLCAKICLPFSAASAARTEQGNRIPL